MLNPKSDFLVEVRLFMLETVKANLIRIQEEIVPYRPRIIAVTKYFGVEAMIAAYEAGLRNFGESRAMESIAKIKELPEYVRMNSAFHFIGHLQSNKVKKVVSHFDYIHSVDSLKLAESISREALSIGKVQKILLQVNNAEEEQKFGYSKAKLIEEFSEIQKLEGIEVVGLMNMTPLGANDSLAEELFKDVADTKKVLEESFNCDMTELSMGMSQDYKIAARCGATMLRIGRKLFS